MVEFNPFADEEPEQIESPTPEQIAADRQDAEEEEYSHQQWLAEEGDENEYSPPPRPPSAEGLPMLRYMINECNERREAAIMKQMAVQQIIVKHANQIREELAAESRSIGSEAFTDRLIRRVLNPARILKSSTEELLVLHRAAREHKGEARVQPGEYSSLEIIEPITDADRAKAGRLLKSVDVRVEPE